MKKTSGVETISFDTEDVSFEYAHKTVDLSELSQDELESEIKNVRLVFDGKESSAITKLVSDLVEEDEKKSEATVEMKKIVEKLEKKLSARIHNIKVNTKNPILQKYVNQFVKEGILQFTTLVDTPKYVVTVVRDSQSESPDYETAWKEFQAKNPRLRKKMDAILSKHKKVRNRSRSWKYSAIKKDK